MDNEEKKEPEAASTVPPVPDTAATAKALEDEIVQLRAKVEEHLSTAKRWQAEFVNYQARVARDREADRKFAIEAFVRELLPAVDTVQHALRQIERSGSAEAVSGAVRLIEKELLRILNKHGVKPIETGQKFDPALHDAIAAVDTPDHEDGAILEELARGYTIHDRLLRPAQVKVARRVEAKA